MVGIRAANIPCVDYMCLMCRKFAHPYAHVESSRIRFECTCLMRRRVANPYAYFGFPHIWPRGYPLDEIRPQAQMERFSRMQAKPLILQGLADKDPDVDAIFR